MILCLVKYKKNKRLPRYEDTEVYPRNGFVQPLKVDKGEDFAGGHKNVETYHSGGRGVTKVDEVKH